MSCHQCQVGLHSKIKTQAPELIPIKVNNALELVGIDLIGKKINCNKLYVIRYLLYNL